MRRPLIAGNWKMNTTVEEAVVLATGIAGGLEAGYAVDTVLCPPFVSLYRVSEIIRGTGLKLGAQNMYSRDNGAFTGETSALMLKAYCQYVILGHSERRQIFGESDQMVNEKVRAAVAAGIIPIFCVGETLDENEAGKTGEILTRQVSEGLKGNFAGKEVVIAYEPIWAIGTGRAADGTKAGQTIELIRGVAAVVLGQEVAAATRILYGGSVTAANIAEFIGQPQIDGALVGGASLKPGEFTDIVKQTASLKAKP